MESKTVKAQYAKENLLWLAHNMKLPPRIKALSLKLGHIVFKIVTHPQCLNQPKVQREPDMANPHFRFDKELRRRDINFHHRFTLHRQVRFF